MKKNIILLLILLSQQFVFSQDWHHDKKNDVHRFSSDVGFLLKSDNRLLIFLTDFIENDVSEYYIRAWTYVDDLGKYIFPCDSKLVFETFDGLTIELEAVFTEMENDMPVAYYPITNEELESLFQGIQNIKIDLIKYKNKNNTYREYSTKKFNKDKLGEYLKKTYEVIENEKKKGYYHNYS